MTRFVAMGDSITVGLGDRMPDRSWRGWAALLADGLGPPGAVEFHNLAELRAQTHTLAERQLPAALDLRPAIAALVVGVNDTLRATFDVTRCGMAMDHAVRQLRRVGATVLTARLPDPGRMFGLPASLARPLARRIHAVNAVVDLVAERYRTVHFDAANHPSTYDRLMWSIDRLHPSERGHRLLARSFADLLAARGVPVYRAPGDEPTNPPPTRRARVMWLATKGTKWLYDRSTDLVPALVSMAAQEWWRGLRGMARRADQLIAREIEQAVTTLRDADCLPAGYVDASAGSAWAREIATCPHVELSYRQASSPV